MRAEPVEAGDGGMVGKELRAHGVGGLAVMDGVEESGEGGL